MAPWGAIIRVVMQLGMSVFSSVLRALPEVYAAGRQGERLSEACHAHSGLLLPLQGELLPQRPRLVEGRR
jgi:hypothetical protein